MTTTWKLPATDRGWVTDGGLETDLLFHHGIDLPDFAAFPLLDDADGRRVLADYYRAYADVAARAGAGLLLETPTWRASTDWGAAAGLRRGRDRAGQPGRRRVPARPGRRRGRRGGRGAGGRVGRPAGRRLHRRRPRRRRLRRLPPPPGRRVRGGGRGPGDGYTLTTVAEAVGVVRAAQDATCRSRCPSPSRPTAACPTGPRWGRRWRRSTRRPARAPPTCWSTARTPTTWPRPSTAGRGRTGSRGLRVNSSRLSHAELDEAEELDEGDLPDLTARTRALASALPAVGVVGGCCGTDARHVAAMCGRVVADRKVAGAVSVVTPTLLGCPSTTSTPSGPTRPRRSSRRTCRRA